MWITGRSDAFANQAGYLLQEEEPLAISAICNKKSGGLPCSVRNSLRKRPYVKYVASEAS